MDPQQIIERQYERVARRKEYYQKNRERILQKNSEYQKKSYHKNRFSLFLDWDLDESAFFTKKDYTYIKKMNENL